MSTPFDLTAPLRVAELGAGERLACLRLARSNDVGPVRFRMLINHFGGAGAALDALPGMAGRAGRQKRIRLCSTETAQAELEAAERLGLRPTFVIEPGYPIPLAAADPPPPLIYMSGHTDLLRLPGIAIVGSRNCSSAGHALARQLAGELGDAGFVVISGLARGVDGSAHRAALDAGTVAVVAGGIDMIYPPEHAELHTQIGKDGCLVSEMPPGFKPRAKDFPRRNRIISGLSYGVVVVEAAKRSGTLITARFANEQGREVLAVPGHPLDPRAEGTNALIKGGATMITCTQDIVEAVTPMVRRPAMPGTITVAEEMDREIPSTVARPHAPAAASADERDVVEQALGPVPVHVDDLLRSTGLSAQALQIALLELSLAGRVEHHGSQRVSRLFDRAGD